MDADSCGADGHLHGWRAHERGYAGVQAGLMHPGEEDLDVVTEGAERQGGNDRLL